ncbi:glycosyltransferase family 2 protein [Candidatus Woesearchaeota archaeon]|nr:glycosyltransferase family 2 protein [Candidatus Woesearchaeota archaeon]
MRLSGKGVKVDIVIPVYNEEAELEKNTIKLDDFLKKNFKHRYSIIIANNASTDSTLRIAKQLSRKFPNISCTNLEQKGRGRALKKAWMASKADIVSYMDVDLSTNLEHFIEIVDAIVKDNYDLAVGSRLQKGSVVRRGLKRQLLSVGYNILLKISFRHRFTDAQCGFKAMKREVAQELVPMTRDQNWFFDTELLLLAERNRYKIFEAPIRWIERKKSKVRILKTVAEYLTSMARMRFRFWRE